MCQPIKLQTLDLKTYKNKNKYKNKTKPPIIKHGKNVIVVGGFYILMNLQDFS